MGKKKEDLFDVGARLKEARQLINKTLKDMAELSGLAKSTISDMEVGIMKPNIHYVKILSKDFNINLNWLMTGKGAKFLPDFMQSFDYGRDKETILELLFLLNKSDRVRYETLLFYIKFKNENSEYIKSLLENENFRIN